MGSSLSSPSPSVGAVRYQYLGQLVQLIAFTLYGYAIYWMYVNLDIPSRKPQGKFAGRWKFLTYWDLIIQFVFYSMAVLTNVLILARGGKMRRSSSDPTQRLIRYRDLFFNSLAFPLATFVSITFWAIYAYDRELIFPKSIEPYYPQWLNQVTHTLIVPINIVEAYLVYHQQPSRRRGLTILLSFIGVYLAWVLYIGLYIDYWVYPILDVLSWPGRVGFFVGSTLIFLAAYVIGEHVHGFLWPGKSGRGGKRATTEASGATVSGRTRSQTKTKRS